MGELYQHAEPPQGPAEAPFALVDTHAHLAWPSLRDLPALLVRSREAGLVATLAVAVDLPTAERSIELAAANHDIFASVGIHPNDLRPNYDMAALRLLAGRERVVAIGETGLDYYRDHTPPALQRAAFGDHLALAAALDLPIIVHNRQADDDILAELSEYRGRVRGVLHCFSGDAALAQEAIKLGFFVSFAGNLTYPSAGDLRAVARSLPAEYLLVETDTPFLSPVPKRGAPNEPAHVGLTLSALAACRGVPPAALASQIRANARVLFRW